MILNSSPERSEHHCCHHATFARAIVEIRERELLELKGPCRTKGCRLHYAHSGPCDVKAGA
jgi:hypothetical protein